MFVISIFFARVLGQGGAERGNHVAVCRTVHVFFERILPGLGPLQEPTALQIHQRLLHPEQPLQVEIHFHQITQNGSEVILRAHLRVQALYIQEPRHGRSQIRDASEDLICNVSNTLPGKQLLANFEQILLHISNTCPRPPSYRDHSHPPLYVSRLQIVNRKGEYVLDEVEGQGLLFEKFQKHPFHPLGFQWRQPHVVGIQALVSAGVPPVVEDYTHPPPPVAEHAGPRRVRIHQPGPPVSPGGVVSLRNHRRRLLQGSPALSVARPPRPQHLLNPCLIVVHQ